MHKLHNVRCATGPHIPSIIWNIQNACTLGLQDVDRMAKQLRLDKDTVVRTADMEILEAKNELEKSRTELESLDLEVAQLQAVSFTLVQRHCVFPSYGI